MYHTSINTNIAGGIFHGVEQNFSYKILTTLVFESDDIQKAQDFELRIPGSDPVKFRSERSWSYMPFIGGLPEPIGRCGTPGVPKFTLEMPSISSSLIYFYRVEIESWSARKPDVFLEDKKI